MKAGSIKCTTMFKYTGTLEYTYNMYDDHIKTLEFEVLWGSPMTDNDLRKKVAEDYANVLGLSQKLGTMVYTVDIVLMEE